MPVEYLGLDAIEYTLIYSIFSTLLAVFLLLRPMRKLDRQVRKGDNNIKTRTESVKKAEPTYTSEELSAKLANAISSVNSAQELLATGIIKNNVAAEDNRIVCNKIKKFYSNIVAEYLDLRTNGYPQEYRDMFSDFFYEYADSLIYCNNIQCLAEAKSAIRMALYVIDQNHPSMNKYRAKLEQIGNLISKNKGIAVNDCVDTADEIDYKQKYLDLFKENQKLAEELELLKVELASLKDRTS